MLNTVDSIRCTTNCMVQKETFICYVRVIYVHYIQIYCSSNTSGRKGSQKAPHSVILLFIMIFHRIVQAK
jgi:hypothetical protein